MNHTASAQFNRLPQSEKAALLSRNGTYLQMSRLEGARTVALFSLNSFFVEASFENGRPTGISAREGARAPKPFETFRGRRSAPSIL